MEETKKINLDSQAKKPTYEELQEQLMKAQQIIMSLRQEAQQKIEALNYANAFQQQQFMLEIVKMHDIFPEDMVAKAVNAIDNFWFEEPKEEETADNE